MFTDTGRIVSDTVEVHVAGGRETAGFRGVWGELGRIGGERGCSDESGSVRRRSRGVARGPEWGKAGGLVVDDEHVVDDVAGRVDA